MLNVKNSLEFRGITKYFPGVKALDDISFTIESGKIVAFLGENGAGKSTLLKIINGDYQPTSGAYILNGVEKHYSDPKEAIEDGIGVIYQERQILLELSIAENIFIGRLPKNKMGLVDTEKLHANAQAIIEEFNLPLDSYERVKNLSIAHQQMVEIMKAYSRDLKLIAFDEPTASLCDSEIDSLFNIIKKLKAEGKIIIYVSHRMQELEMLADEIAIFKDGKFITKAQKSEMTQKDMIKLMVGRDLGDIFKDLKREKQLGEDILSVENLSNQVIKNVSFSLKKGEILGFSGLVGSGRTEVMRAIIGADKIMNGTIKVEGNAVSFNNPSDSIKSGIVLVPEDRKLQGILPNLSVGENISIGILEKISTKLGFVNVLKERKIVSQNIEKFKIKTPYQEKKIVELSGGNQQKCIVARWLETDPKVLILDEPTKGIDIGAKSEFYNLIMELANSGLSILLISSELPEIIGLSDRIIVMKNGVITGEVNKEDATEDVLLSYAMLG